MLSTKLFLFSALFLSITGPVTSYAAALCEVVLSQPHDRVLRVTPQLAERGSEFEPLAFEPGGAGITKDGRWYILTPHTEEHDRHAFVVESFAPDRIPTIVKVHLEDYGGGNEILLSPNRRFVGYFNNSTEGITVVDRTGRVPTYHLPQRVRPRALGNSGQVIVYDARRSGAHRIVTAHSHGLIEESPRDLQNQEFQFVVRDSIETFYYIRRADGVSQVRRGFDEVLMFDEHSVFGGLVVEGIGVFTAYDSELMKNRIPQVVGFVIFNPLTDEPQRAFKLDFDEHFDGAHFGVLSQSQRFYVFGSGEWHYVVDLHKEELVLRVRIDEGSMSSVGGFNAEETQYRFVWADEVGVAEVISVRLP